MEQSQEWYEATVIDNSILGESFPVGEGCVFRRYGCSESKTFEIFNVNDMSTLLSGDKAKTQLRSTRDRNNAVVRAKDQGYIDWKYTNFIRDCGLRNF